MWFAKGREALVIDLLLVLGLFVSAISSTYLPARAARSASSDASNSARSDHSEVTTNGTTVAAPKFNGKIAFYSTRNSQAFDIYSMNPDGSSATRLTDDQCFGLTTFCSSYDGSPAWSPDGTKLAFVSNRDGTRLQIYTMNPDGSAVKRLTDNTVDVGEPAWSPDGTKIAFTRGSGCVVVGKPGQITPSDDDPCKPYIYVMNSDGSNPVNVSQTTGWGAVWSPDGSKIAFSAALPGTFGSEIFVVNMDGSNKVQLTNNLSNDLVSSWSPDGSKLAFSSDRDAGPDSFIFEIYTMSISGTNQTRLTNNNVDDFGPVFSPDGTMIAFQRGQATFSGDPTDNTEIFVMNVDGSNQTNITRNKADDFGPPAWQSLSSPLQVSPPAILQFSAANYNVDEGAGSLELTVSRSGNTTETTTVEYDSTDGTASERSDYTRAFGTLRFAPGETSKTLRVLITDDGFTEGTETLSLFLHDLTGNATIAGQGSATVSIIDNDATPAPTNPLENSQFFVRQQYYDFLNREPDPAGFAFWVNNIESCGADAACREVKKIDTSAAFFLSIEYQQTQFYVYRIYSETYKAQYYLDIIRDAQEISRNLIVGSPGWEQQLDTNTQRFTEDFVSRPQFRLNYSEGMAAQAYVDLLYSRHSTFVPPPAAERNQAIAAYGSGDATGRARALRIVANNANFKQQQFNQAFISAEYFGYLRRDGDYQGYAFWRAKLDKFNGDFRRAEMVKAFLNSSEYRSRFGR